MKLEEILAEVPVQSWSQNGQPAMEIAGLAYDSRQVAPGFLFFCVPGHQADGHNFAQQAVAKGAAALVVERFLPLDVPQILVDSARSALAQAASCFYGHPSRHLWMIGVTGTNGKTTTTHLIEAVLRRHGKKVGLIGTIGNRLGDQVWPAAHTTPESLDLQALLATMRAAGADAVVMEVSSHALELGRVAGVDFDVAVFTNLTQDHLDFHHTLENYRQAKGRLFQQLSAGNNAKFAVINADDPEASYFINTSAVQVLTYGSAQAADVHGRDVEVTPRGAACQVDYPGGTATLQLALTGHFNIANALAAFTVGVASGVPSETMVAALAQVRGVPGRFEPVGGNQPFSVIVDYAHTPDGLENVLKTARAITAGRIITVFGCGGDRDRTKRPLMGREVARWSDWAMVTSDNPRTEAPLAIIDDILPGVRSVEGVQYRVEPDRRQAIAMALQEAQAGDLVLIAGKGHETYQIIGREVHDFDDRQVAQSELAKLGYGP
ncbi:UDP-N-acetylmuramoyl-L-alanyl-D-glutamate--2,6-diaminopimelate ligase [Heliophilum fasciatum]|uniref:UDP-N-acetylmuramoyl-L-alanyl-D-glutamate--2,6-diaminopimelate ligase n=1 Tax=Heliophilum fasciatum TaxID=35700 RepID=A0A4V2SWF8_9FIRM|nr:UDP-N-acetylmuramoyl-L-alanyl-D-glutamate--2,6-diaminopimelate ligase [Heliophilum fasciatum]MCW2278852.1 UDP-N-acetylmuramoyl-L-alanyl-D-glutamate--2,6-diaminopimelate ligase [Heliophilum fasciatum]TCP62136.1 UDP-N-acetylmuramoylalanyl-D-glutamate--2,6-diaminopimelate ligase [Heliophilum fasciatum]